MDLMLMRYADWSCAVHSTGCNFE